MKPVLIILSAGQSEYREFMLARIADRYRLALISPEPVTWEAAYIVDHFVVPPADIDGFIAAAADLAARYPVAGVFTYDEWCVGTAARIAELLELPHCPLEAVSRCRDKWASRQSWREAGVPSAASELVSSPAEAHEAARRIGYPVVVKPRALSASFAVTRAFGPEDLAPAFDSALTSGPKRAWHHLRGVLVEEYLDGPEISVDSTVSTGRVTPVIYAKKVLGYAPHFEEVGHIVAPAEEITPDAARVADVVRAAHAALGVDETVTHTEIRLTSTGPRIVEVNGRLGGGLIPELALLATGYDIGLAGADIAAGRVPPGPAAGAGRTGPNGAAAGRAAGIRFFYAETAGVVQSCDIDPELKEAPWIHRLEWLLPPGSDVRPEPGRRFFARAGFAIVVADSVAECESRMQMLADHVSIRLDGH